jgi:hypothetical protein
MDKVNLDLPKYCILDDKHISIINILAYVRCAIQKMNSNNDPGKEITDTTTIAITLIAMACSHCSEEMKQDLKKLVKCSIDAL